MPERSFTDEGMLMRTIVQLNALCIEGHSSPKGVSDAAMSSN